ncbi:hypothetical protein BCR36DRAFT_372509 [Piromyces finnis]|uniref:Uncharacterized protein n=1 Tax=Piromyces finnis TaxID=1754191 RepID=A0A1Y1V444_9FUNG|nr:hypothetical protein BCR36DRAFT_372509 [Piromyces finnis]|eukprot:ORX46021.1 hypothetical protein BCR36DRAFT_372509 [Piromyces finnis]
MNGLLNLNYYSDDDSDNDNNQTSNKSPNTTNSTLNTDSHGLLSLVNYNNDDDRNSPRPKKSNSLFASLIRRKASSSQKQKTSSKIINSDNTTSDTESGANPSQAISQLINNTLNNDNSSLKVINLHDKERTYALKKRIYGLLNPNNENSQQNKSSTSENDKENKESENKSTVEINVVDKNDNDSNMEDIKLILEDYGLPIETNDKCDPELQNRFSEWRYKKAKGLVFDKNFDKNSALEDPFIIRNLIDTLGIKEIGSNFAKDKFNPLMLPKKAHYKELYKQNTTKVQIQTVPVPVQLPNQGGIGVLPSIQFVQSSMPKTSGIDLAEVSAKIQKQIKDAAAKAAAANTNINKISASLSFSSKPNNIPVTIANSKNSTTTSSTSTGIPYKIQYKYKINCNLKMLIIIKIDILYFIGYVKKSKWDMQ